METAVPKIAPEHNSDAPILALPSTIAGIDPPELCNSEWNDHPTEGAGRKQLFQVDFRNARGPRLRVRRMTRSTGWMIPSLAEAIAASCRCHRTGMARSGFAYPWPLHRADCHD